MQYELIYTFIIVRHKIINALKCNMDIKSCLNIGSCGKIIEEYCLMLLIYVVVTCINHHNMKIYYEWFLSSGSTSKISLIKK